MTYDGHPSATATGRPCFSSDSASSLELRQSGGLIGSRQSYKQNEINSLEHCHARELAPPLLLGFGTLPGPTFRLVRAFLLATLCIVSLACFLHACFCTPLSPARNCVAPCPGNFVHCQLDTFPACMLLHSALACQELRCPLSWQLCALTASHVSCMHASALRSRLPGIALPFLLQLCALSA